MDFYKPDLVKLFKNPHNFGTLEDADIEIVETNATCGDEIKMQIKLDKKTKKVVDVKYVCFGCLVCITSSSVFTDMMKGKTLAEVKKITLEDINKVLQIPITSAKLNCISLSMKAVNKGISQYEQKK
ncbi:iron-sulfur cluster assembly scaffold protein [Candidatus Beckwithbacteria bacterium]|nr:iron-sulfur cluster assembly scaffold protein [Candidatus Beckwithbacteria bacterium]